MNITSLADQLLFITAQLIGRTSSGEEWAATGFLHAVETEKGNAYFLVTNRHVLEGGEELEVKMIGADAAAQPRLGTPAGAKFTPLAERSWAAHPDPRVDVAVLAFGEVLEAMEKRGICPYFKTCGPENCLTEQTAEDLNSIEEVIFIGYPLGLYDSSTLLPVVRKGITATPVWSDYEGKPAFLIDGAVFPGSSGSPVFILNEGGYWSRTGFNVGSSRLILLGVVAAVHVHPTTGVVAPAPAALATCVDIPAGLGIVYKASTISECVDAFLMRSGLHRVTPPGASG